VTVQREPMARKRPDLRAADIVVENFRPGPLENGAGLENIEAHSGTVRSGCGYGQTGPIAERAGFGAIGEARGLRYVTGIRTRPPGGGHQPRRAVASLYGVIGA